jgi:3-hydroxyisobutyrate dehydrogenase
MTDFPRRSFHGESPPELGYVGLGHMGAALARRLLRTNPLFVYDTLEAATQALVDEGASAAPDPASLAAQCDVVFLCLPNSDDVHRVLFGKNGIATSARPGTLVVDQTTGDPHATRSMAADLATQGIELIDAPVSGGVKGAEAGTITIMVGATPTTYTLMHPILETISPNIQYAGQVGAGHVVKLVNNLLSHSQRLLTFEGISLAAKNGVDPTKAVEILAAGGGRNAFLERRMGPVTRGDLDVGFTLGLAHKDLRLACQLGIASEVPMLYGNLSRESYQSLISQLGRNTEVDHAALVVDRIAGTCVVPNRSTAER